MKVGELRKKPASIWILRKMHYPDCRIAHAMRLLYKRSPSRPPSAVSVTLTPAIGTNQIVSMLTHRLERRAHHRERLSWSRATRQPQGKSEGHPARIPRRIPRRGNTGELPPAVPY